jgi:transcriptional coactivator HFI1/ADA1
MSLLGKVCTNGPGFVKTGEFKKKMDSQDATIVEADERRKRKMLCMEDLKLALRLGDGYLGQTPIIAGSILNSRCLDTEGMEDLYNYEDLEKNGNGHVGGEVWNVDFVNGLDAGDPMQIDGEEGWQGADADGLDGVLDDVLNFADL